MASPALRATIGSTTHQASSFPAAPDERNEGAYRDWASNIPSNVRMGLLGLAQNRGFSDIAGLVNNLMQSKLQIYRASLDPNRIKLIRAEVVAELRGMIYDHQIINETQLLEGSVSLPDLPEGQDPTLATKVPLLAAAADDPSVRRLVFHPTHPERHQTLQIERRGSATSRDCEAHGIQLSTHPVSQALPLNAIPPAVKRTLRTFFRALSEDPETRGVELGFEEQRFMFSKTPDCTRTNPRLNTPSGLRGTPPTEGGAETPRSQRRASVKSPDEGHQTPVSSHRASTPSTSRRSRPLESPRKLAVPKPLRVNVDDDHLSPLPED